MQANASRSPWFGREKKGATFAPFLSAERVLPLLAALLLAALGCFLCHCSESPLSAWCHAQALNSAVTSRPRGLPESHAERPGVVAEIRISDKAQKKGAAEVPHPAA
jgi:hypothetical protein